jgi:hypothetical protein
MFRLLMRKTGSVLVENLTTTYVFTEKVRKNKLEYVFFPDMNFEPCLRSCFHKRERDLSVISYEDENMFSGRDMYDFVQK